MLQPRRDAARRRHRERVDAAIGLTLLWIGPVVVFVLAYLRIR